MEIVKWSNELSVGVKEIDNQHQKFVLLLNRLFESMQQGKSKLILSGLLVDLIEYTIYHFKCEEDYFDKFNYQEAASHKLSHKQFIEKILAFKEAFDNGKVTLSIELFRFLKEWLVNHIQGEDNKYSMHFLSNGLE